MEEEKWILHAARGDKKAFEQLVLLYQNRVYNLALRMLSNADDAYDITQEVFLKAWQHLPRLSQPGAFSSWIFRMTGNSCIDHLRQAKRHRTLPLQAPEDEDAPFLQIPDAGPTPEEALLQQFDRQTLRAAFALLPDAQRQLLSLRVIDELSYQQIAEVLQIAEGTVKSRLSRAREALRKNLLSVGNKAQAEASELSKEEVGLCSVKERLS